MRRNIACFLTLLVVPVGAAAGPATDTWGISLSSGAAVMGEPAGLAFSVSNDSANNGTHRLSFVSITLKSNDYYIEGGEAPPGWRLASINKQSRIVEFEAIDPCANGIAPGGHLEPFILQVVGEPASQDRTDSFHAVAAAGATWSGTSCANNTVVYYSPSPSASWKRASISATLETNPRSLGVGGSLTLTMTVSNRGTTSATVSPSVPVVTGIAGSPTALFTLTAGTAPSSLALAPGNSGVFEWTYRADDVGVFYFNASAGDAAGTKTSLSARTLQGDVGSFPAYTDIFPSKVTSPQSIRATLAVSNHSTSPYIKVQPDGPPGVSGTASVACDAVSTPASVSYLAPGSTAIFSWNCVVTGEVGDTFALSARGLRMAGSTPVYSDPVNTVEGFVVSHSLVSTPVAVPQKPTPQRIVYTVYNGAGQSVTELLLYVPDTTYFSSPSAPPPDIAGWTESWDASLKAYRWTAVSGGGIGPSQSASFPVDFTAIAPYMTITDPVTIAHRMQVTQADGATTRVSTPVTVFVKTTPPDVSSLVAVSSGGSNALLWTNPEQKFHDGVLIVRAQGGAATGIPEAGRRYFVGESVGNGQVIYSDSRSFASSFVDSDVVVTSPLTRYYYRVFNHDEYFNYSSCNVPTVDGLMAEATNGNPGTPLWCYSTGVSMTQQAPVTELGAAVYSANNHGYLFANLTRPGDLADGGERWRPVKLGQGIEGRFQILPLRGRAGNTLVVGDKSGGAFAVDPVTGAIVWGPVGMRGALIAPAAAELYDYMAAKCSDPVATDRLFFGTNETTGNSVFALSQTGQQIWTTPVAGAVRGGMAVDYSRNRLWVATTAGLYVLDTCNGGPTLVLPASSSQGVTLDYQSGVFHQALFVDDLGLAHGFDLGTMSEAWSVQLKDAAGNTRRTYQLLQPTGGGFLAALADGSIQRYRIDASTTPAVTMLWSTSIPGPPSSIAIDYTSQKIFVGGANGLLHQFSVAGILEKSVAVGDGVGAPTIDRNASRLHVETLDGRVCAFESPL